MEKRAAGKPPLQPGGMMRVLGAIVGKGGQKERKKGPVQVRLGEKNDFYYDENRKMWVERGKEAEADSLANTLMSGPPSFADLAQAAGEGGDLGVPVPKPYWGSSAGGSEVEEEGFAPGMASAPNPSTPLRAGHGHARSGSHDHLPAPGFRRNDSSTSLSGHSRSSSRAHGLRRYVDPGYIKTSADGSRPDTPPLTVPPPASFAQPPQASNMGKVSMFVPASSQPESREDEDEPAREDEAPAPDGAPSQAEATGSRESRGAPEEQQEQLPVSAFMQGSQASDAPDEQQSHVEQPAPSHHEGGADADASAGRRLDQEAGAMAAEHADQAPGQDPPQTTAPSSEQEQPSVGQQDNVPAPEQGTEMSSNTELTTDASLQGWAWDEANNEWVATQEGASPHGHPNGAAQTDGHAAGWSNADGTSGTPAEWKAYYESLGYEIDDEKMREWEEHYQRQLQGLPHSDHHGPEGAADEHQGVGHSDAAAPPAAQASHEVAEGEQHATVLSRGASGLFNGPSRAETGPPRSIFGSDSDDERMQVVTAANPGRSLGEALGLPPTGSKRLRGAAGRRRSRLPWENSDSSSDGSATGSVRLALLPRKKRSHRARPPGTAPASGATSFAATPHKTAAAVAPTEGASAPSGQTDAELTASADPSNNMTVQQAFGQVVNEGKDVARGLMQNFGAAINGIHDAIGRDEDPDDEEYKRLYGVQSAAEVTGTDALPPPGPDAHTSPDRAFEQDTIGAPYQPDGGTTASSPVGQEGLAPAHDMPSGWGGEEAVDDSQPNDAAEPEHNPGVEHVEGSAPVDRPEDGPVPAFTNSEPEAPHVEHEPEATHAAHEPEAPHVEHESPATVQDVHPPGEQQESAGEEGLQGQLEAAHDELGQQVAEGDQLREELEAVRFERDAHLQSMAAAQQVPDGATSQPVALNIVVRGSVASEVEVPRPAAQHSSGSLSLDDLQDADALRRRIQELQQESKKQRHGNQVLRKRLDALRQELAAAQSAAHDATARGEQVRAEMQALQQERDEAWQRVEALMQEHGKEEGRLAEASETLEAMRRRALAAEARCDELTEMLESGYYSNAAQQQNPQQLEELSKALQDNKAALAELQNERESLFEQLRTAHAAQQDAEAARWRVQEVESELADANERVEEREAKIKRAVGKIRQLQKEIADVKREKAELEAKQPPSEDPGLRSEVDSLSSRLHAAQDELSSLQRQLREVEEARQDAQARHATAQQEAMDARAELDSVRAEAAASFERASAADARLSDLQAVVDDLRGQLERAQQDSTDELRAAHSNADAARQQVAEACEARDAAVAQVEQLRSALEDAQAQVAASMSSPEEVEALRQQVAAMQEEVDVGKKRYQGLRVKAKKQLDELSARQKHAMQEAQQANESHEAEAAASAARIQALENSLREEGQKVQSLQQQLEVLQAQLTDAEAARSALSDARARLDEVTSRLEAMQSALQQAQQSEEALRRELEEARDRALCEEQGAASRVAELESEVARLAQANIESSQDAAASRQALQEAEVRAAALEAAKQELAANVSTAQQAAAHAQELQARAEAELQSSAAQSSRVADLEKEVEKLTTVRKKAVLAMKRAQSERDAAQGRLKEAEGAGRDAQAALDDLQRECEQLRADGEALRARLSALEASTTPAEEVDSLRQSLQNATAELAAVKAERDGLSASLELATEQSGQLNQGLAGAREELAARMAEAETWQVKVAAVQDEAEAARTRAEHAEEQLRQIAQERDRLAEELASAPAAGHPSAEDDGIYEQLRAALAERDEAVQRAQDLSVALAGQEKQRGAATPGESGGALPWAGVSNPLFEANGSEQGADLAEEVARLRAELESVRGEKDAREEEFQELLACLALEGGKAMRFEEELRALGADNVDEILQEMEDFYDVDGAGNL
ncbi:unnamed protein product [Pedinophyceae sp. YPF-701]|nr:unnamed protein product [Pedinophyceae sp. YPF-701]